MHVSLLPSFTNVLQQSYETSCQPFGNLAFSPGTQIERSINLPRAAEFTGLICTMFYAKLQHKSGKIKHIKQTKTYEKYNLEE